MTPEGELKKSITDALDQLGIFWLRLNSGLIRKGARWIHLCPEGTPDLVIYPRGKGVVWCETKVKGGKRTPEQVAFAEKVIDLGHHYLCCTSLDSLIAFLGGIK